MNLTTESTALLTLSNVAGKIDLLSRESAALLTVGDGTGDGDVLITSWLGGIDNILPWLGLGAGRLSVVGRHDHWFGGLVLERVRENSGFGGQRDFRG